MGEDFSKEATYVEFSIHHLEIAGRLPTGPQQDEYLAHPLHAKLAADWLAQDDSSVAAVELLRLQEKLFSAWSDDRRASIEAYLPSLGLPSSVCAEAHEILMEADRKLVAGIAKSRVSRPAQPVKEAPEGDLVLWPGPGMARELADFLAHLASDEAGSVKQARSRAGISREEAGAAARTLQKVAAVKPPGPAPAKAPRPQTVSKTWQKLWDDPSKMALPVLSGAARALHDKFAPHLLTDDELCASPQYQELVVRVNVPVGSSPERYREKTLAILRDSPVEDLPIGRSVTSEVARVLNTYFANWQLNLDAEMVASFVQSLRGRSETT